MSMRVLIVIALLLQSLATVGPRAVDASAIDETCSCATVCCCGDGSASDQCAREPVAVCMCAPVLPERVPEAPPPRDGKQFAPFLALSLTGIAVTLPDPSRHAWARIRCPRWMGSKLPPR